MKRKKVLRILVAIFIVWIILFATDTIRACKNSHPLFCVSTSYKIDETGEIIYTGIFYKVTRTHGEYHVSPWFF